VSTDSLYTRDLNSGDRRIGSEIKGRYTVNPTLDITAGGRAVETRTSADTNEVYSGILGANYRPSFLPGASLHGEFEQDFRETDNWRLTVGGDYQWNPNLRLYATNEISSADTGFFGLGDGASTNFTTKVGAEYQVTDEVSGFSEVRQSAGAASDGG